MKCSQERCEYFYNISVAVTGECCKGQLFRLCAFNKFATSLADACLHEGDFAAFCSPRIWENSQYRIEEGCHHLEADIGLPEQPSAKIFFARKPHITVISISSRDGSITQSSAVRNTSSSLSSLLFSFSN